MKTAEKKYLDLFFTESGAGKGGAMAFKDKRNPYRIVNKSHQYRFLAVILIYNLLIAGILVAVLFVPDFIRVNDQNLSIEVRAVAADNILMLHSRVWLVIAATVSVIGLHSIRMFGRFVGPLYRFMLTFMDVRDGKLGTRIKLRKKDFLVKEADAFNDMLDVINEKIVDIKVKGQDAMKLLGKFEQEKIEGEGQVEPDSENVAALQKKLHELNETLNYFKTK